MTHANCIRSDRDELDATVGDLSCLIAALQLIVTDWGGEGLPVGSMESQRRAAILGITAAMEERAERDLKARRARRAEA
jgi:hypothetical protein